MKRKILIFLFLLFIIFTGGMMLLRENSRNDAIPDIFEETRLLMGTSWTVKIPLSEELARGSASQAAESVFIELARIENLMSEWRPETAVSLINSNAGVEPVKVPDELYTLIERGIEFGRLSQGAFDISWKGMGSLWTFGENFRIPEEETIREAAKNVDFRKIALDEGTVFLQDQGMAIGLGGIAKGYAIDRAGHVLRESGIVNFLIDGGGDILASGSVSGRSWIVGIRDPRGSRSELIKKLSVSGGAVVTSGDYERFRIVDGHRYHHIIDPRTGYPADKCRSVTVFSSNAETADVLATAVFVLGPEAGMELINRYRETEALIVDASGGTLMSQGFDDLIHE